MQKSDSTKQSVMQPLLAQAMMSTANAIFITDGEGKIVWANDAFSRLSGYSVEDTIGRTPALLKSGKQSPTFYTRMWQTIREGNIWQGEVIDQRKDGTLYTVDEIVTPLFDEKGTITHFIAIQHDITRQKIERERDHHMAYHDILTDLPNRAHFIDVLEHAISHAKRTQRPLAVLFLDLDRFKPVNDTLGHRAGDQLLSAVAERLRASVRLADMVARFGGDEFAILLTNFPDLEVATTLAEKLLETLARPFMLRAERVSVSASIGIALYPPDGEDPETLLVNADKAMYQAKSHGGNSYQLYKAAIAMVH